MPACASAGEPRGPGVLAAGLCVVCGRSTTRRDGAGNPRHALLAVPGPRCPECGGALDGGPVLYRCEPCGKSLYAADLDREVTAGGAR